MKIFKLLSIAFLPILALSTSLFTISCSTTPTKKTEIEYSMSNSDGSSSSTITYGNTLTITASGTNIVGKFDWQGVMFDGDNNGYTAEHHGDQNEILTITNTNLDAWDVNIGTINIIDNGVFLRVTENIFIPTAIIKYTVENSDAQNPSGMTILYNGTLTITASSPNLKGMFAWTIPSSDNYTSSVTGGFQETLTITNKNVSSSDITLDNVSVSDSENSINIDQIILDTGAIDYTLLNSDTTHPNSPVIGYGNALTITATALNSSGDFEWAGIDFGDNPYYTAVKSTTPCNIVTITNKNTSAADWILDGIIITNGSMSDGVETITVDTNVIDYVISNSDTTNSPIIAPGGFITITASAPNRVGLFSWDGIPSSNSYTTKVDGDYKEILTIKNTNQEQNNINISTITVSNNGYVDNVEPITVVTGALSYTIKNTAGSTSPVAAYGQSIIITAKSVSPTSNYVWSNISSNTGYDVTPSGTFDDTLTIKNTNLTPSQIVIPSFTLSSDQQTITISETIIMLTGAISYTFTNSDPSDPNSPILTYGNTITIVANSAIPDGAYVWTGATTTDKYQVTTSGGTDNNTLVIKSINASPDDVYVPTISVADNSQSIIVSQSILVYSGVVTYSMNPSNGSVAFGSSITITASSRHYLSNFSWNGLTIGTNKGITYTQSGSSNNNKTLTIYNENTTMDTITVPANTITITLNGYTVSVIFPIYFYANN